MEPENIFANILENNFSLICMNQKSRPVTNGLSYKQTNKQFFISWIYLSIIRDLRCHLLAEI